MEPEVRRIRWYRFSDNTLRVLMFLGVLLAFLLCVAWLLDRMQSENKESIPAQEAGHIGLNNVAEAYDGTIAKPQASSSKHSALAALLAIREALDSGAPFLEAHESLIELTAHDHNLVAQLEILAPYTASGVVSPMQLLLEFQHLTPDSNLETPVDPNQSRWRLLVRQFFAAKVKIITPAMKAYAQERQHIRDNVMAAISVHNYQDALALSDNLEPQNHPELQAWQNRIKRRQELEAAYKTLKQSLITQQP